MQTFGLRSYVPAWRTRALPVLSLCCNLLICEQLAAAAPQPEPAEQPSIEIQLLKKRVAELEAEAHALAQTVAAMEARMVSAQPSTAAPAPVLATSSAPRENAQKPERAVDTSRLKFYGMARLDVDIDTQRPNSPQTPLFISSETAGKGGSFAMHPRLTRFGLDFTGGRIESLGGAQLSGELETDFENGGSESRQIIRIRHAYLKSSWKEFSILAGQTWDVFSPLFPTVNNDTLMWNAGNVGDRRPQIRATYEPKTGRGQFSFAVAAGLTGAIDPVDLDGNGYPDGTQSMRPNVQSRLGYSHALGVADQPFSAGVSLFYGWLEVARPIGGRFILPAEGYNIDLTVPLMPRLAIRGEGWWGRNMSDFRGGAGQAVTLATGRVVRGRGGWAEAKLRVNRYWSIAPGYTTDNPVKADLATGNRTRNRAFYVGNRFSPGGKLDLGADYLRWRTDYLGLLPGADNRINLFVQYGF